MAYIDEVYICHRLYGTTDNSVADLNNPENMP